MKCSLIIAKVGVLTVKQARNKLLVDADFIMNSLSNNSNDYIYLWDLVSGAYLISANMAEDFSMSQEGTDFANVWETVIHHKDAKRVRAHFKKVMAEQKCVFHVEYQVMNTYGNSMWIRDSSTIRYSEITREAEMVIGVLHNLELDGSVDLITGLLTQDKCRNVFEYLRNCKSEMNGAAMLIGIDDFTAINTSNNHAFGDLVLRKIAQDVLNMISEQATMYRFDGDQFLILMQNSIHEDMIQLYAKIKQYSSHMYNINNITYRFNVSAGIACFPKDGITWGDFEKSLSIALKKAKESGKNQYVVYEKEMLEEKIYEQTLSRYMLESVEHECEGFKVVYQPVCHTQSLKVKGAEVLLRFITPEGDLINPLEFIPLLEHSKLIHEVGLWVLEEAIKTCKKWIAYIPDFVMNVNVSYIQLRNLDFCDKVEALLKKHEMDSRHITLELTETYFIVDAEHINTSMRRLKELHLQVAMDDFGTGYSSLARLSQFNVDVIKIDRIFVQALNKSKYNYDFIDSVVRLCHNIGMKVCIEGVETREEQTSICLLNADYIQGFYVSRPIDEDIFFNKYILEPYINDELIVVPDSNRRHDQLISDKGVLLAMMDACPLALNFWSRDYEIIACNVEVLRLFEVTDFEVFKHDFFKFCPEYQPNGRKSVDEARRLIKEAYDGKRVNAVWHHCLRNKELLPVEVTIVRIPYMNDFIVASYSRDMREQLQLEEKNKRFNSQLKAILDASPLCLNLWNKKYQNTMCNLEAINLFNLNNKQEYIDHFFELSPAVQPNGISSDELAIAYIKEAFQNGRKQFYWLHQDLDKQNIPCEITLVRVDCLDDDGEDMVAGFTRDMRAQLAGESMQRQANERIQEVLNAMPLACILWSLDMKIIDCNDGAINMFGARDKADVIQNFDAFLPEQQPDGSKSQQKKDIKFKQALDTGRSFFEWIYVNQQKEEIPCEVTMVKVVAEHEEIIVAYSRDLRELHQTLEVNDRLSKIAYYDLLTGSASRAKFMEKLEEHFTSAEQGQLLALMIFDIDYFKLINDTYGHDAGDMVLKRVVKCAENNIPEQAVIGRYGGDEFMIFVQDYDEAAVQQIMDQLVHEISAIVFHHGRKSFRTSISIGAAFKSIKDKHSHQLLKRADKALYEAKAKGRNCSMLVTKNKDHRNIILKSKDNGTNKN